MHEHTHVTVCPHMTGIPYDIVLVCVHKGNEEWLQKVCLVTGYTYTLTPAALEHACTYHSMHSQHTFHTTHKLYCLHGG